jgi:hypothetical protein
MDLAVVIVVILGSAAGAVIVGLCPALFEDFFLDESGNFYLNMFLTTSVNSGVLFRNTTKVRLELLLVVSFISFTRPKKVFFLILMFVLGLCGGTVISENTIYYIGTGHFAGKYIGMLVYLVSVLPQYLFYGVALLIIYRYCIKKDAPAGRLAAYIAVCAVIFLAGTFFESYFSPNMLKWILKIV